MATRTNDLTEIAKPIADKLAARCGSLKRVLSAGVLALEDMESGEREFYMAKAVGQETEHLQDAKARLQEKVLQILKEAQAIPEPTKQKKKGRTA